MEDCKTNLEVQNIKKILYHYTDEHVQILLNKSNIYNIFTTNKLVEHVRQYLASEETNVSEKEEQISKYYVIINTNTNRSEIVNVAFIGHLHYNINYKIWTFDVIPLVNFELIITQVFPVLFKKIIETSSCNVVNISSDISSLLRDVKTTVTCMSQIIEHAKLKIQYSQYKVYSFEEYLQMLNDIYAESLENLQQKHSEILKLNHQTQKNSNFFKKQNFQKNWLNLDFQKLNIKFNFIEKLLLNYTGMDIKVFFNYTNYDYTESHLPGTIKLIEEANQCMKKEQESLKRISQVPQFYLVINNNKGKINAAYLGYLCHNNQVNKYLHWKFQMIPLIYREIVIEDYFLITEKIVLNNILLTIDYKSMYDTVNNNAVHITHIIEHVKLRIKYLQLEDKEKDFKKYIESLTKVYNQAPESLEKVHYKVLKKKEIADVDNN